MPYTADNIEITIATGTAILATDYGTSGAVGFSAAHAQIAKMAWGDDNNTYRVSDATPMPIKIAGSTGTTVPISGTISGTGNFFIRTNDSFPIRVIGSTLSSDARVGITGTIQGIANGTPVGVTGNVSILGSAVVIGTTNGYPITVTGGRRLNSSTDSVQISGNVGISGGLQLLAGIDSVSVYGPAGSTWIETNLNVGGVALGRSGDALKVAVTNTGFTFSVSLSSTIGVTNDTSTSGLRVEGVCGGTPLTIRGSLSGGAVEIGAYTPVPVGVSGTIQIDDTDLITEISSLKTNIGTVATNAGYALDILNLINSAGSGAKVNITSITRPNRLAHGQRSLTTSPTVLGSESLRTGVTLKSPSTNSVDIYIGNSLAVSAITGYILSPGESIYLEISTLGSLFARTANSTATLVYIGS